ncbi:MAG TPA: hypothetical protein VNK70_01310 [Candidatus Paceibacterota bacterium]|nr:hypothetical protein [Candidatus Paceibacterota bacterium]
MKILKFFDKLEDKIRATLSRHPVVYALVGGAAIVLFWRGVWHLADEWNLSTEASLIVSIIIMLLTGTFVSFFIGERLLLSGLKKEKRIDEKTLEEVEREESRIKEMHQHLLETRKDLAEIKKKLGI